MAMSDWRVFHSATLFDKSSQASGEPPSSRTFSSKPCLDVDTIAIIRWRKIISYLYAWCFSNMFCNLKNCPSKWSLTIYNYSLFKSSPLKICHAKRKVHLLSIIFQGRGRGGTVLSLTWRRLIEMLLGSSCIFSRFTPNEAGFLL